MLGLWRTIRASLSTRDVVYIAIVAVIAGALSYSILDNTRALRSLDVLRGVKSGFSEQDFGGNGGRADIFGGVRLRQDCTP